MKCAKVDVEHIKTTDAFISGYFASYHVYPYYPDYLNYIYIDKDDDDIVDEERKSYEVYEIVTPDNFINDYITESIENGFTDSRGRVNTYYAYLKALNNYHTIPVVISEYGVSTGRGMAQRDYNTGRSQGNMSEDEQGQAIIECYEDIMNAGCAGSCVFTWQDEWFKRTWNTMHAVDLENTPYWSDYQTNEQYFGLLAFDPGETESVCYVDGDVSEWNEEDIVVDNEDISLSMKYDEKFIYFLIKKDGFSSDEDTIYIPIDTNPKIGSTYCDEYNLSFDRGTDFLIVIDGKENSRVLVQERNEVLRAMFYHETQGMDPYIDIIDEDIPIFKPISLMLQTATPLLTGDWEANAETYETGLLEYGNANPSSDDFNSLADFTFSGDYIELKLPWQLLNFSNPSEMMIHDDYYIHYGVEYIHIDEMYIGAAFSGNTEGRISMTSYPLEGWGKEVTYH